jgi:hypothetical protein
MHHRPFAEGARQRNCTDFGTGSGRSRMEDVFGASQAKARHRRLPPQQSSAAL